MHPLLTTPIVTILGQTTIVPHQQNCSSLLTGFLASSLEIFSWPFSPSSRRDHFLFFYKFIYFILFLFLAVLGLRCCTRAPSSCGEQGPLLIVVRGLLTAVASLVVEHEF